MSRDIKEREVVFVDDFWEIIDTMGQKSSNRVEEQKDCELGKLYEAGYCRAIQDFSYALDEAIVLLGDLDLWDETPQEF